MTGTEINTTVLWDTSDMHWALIVDWEHRFTFERRGLFSKKVERIFSDDHTGEVCCDEY